MDGSPLTLRPVTMADARLLHEWRNDPDTRRGSRQTEAIGWPQHEAWLAAALADTDRVLRIAEAGGEPLGVLRADRRTDGWELSWTVAPRARGRGIGTRMLSLFVAGLEGRLAAVVRKGNLASAKMAAAAGMRLQDDAPEDGFELWARK